MFHFTKKRAVVIAVVGSLALGAGAYAYFSAAGAGTGSATTGSSSAIVITHTNQATLGSMYPGGPGRTVNIDVGNPSDGSQYVGSVHVDSITTDTDHGTCNLAAFTMPDVAISAALAGHQTVHTSGTLTMSDTGVSQNSCEGAPLTLHFSSN
jgi:hypothetical protein